MKKKLLKWLLFLVPGIAVIVIDQITKFWAAGALKGQGSIVLLKGVLELHYVENTGMAFGLLKDSQVFFYIVTGIALLAILYVFIRIPFDKRYTALVLLLSLISGGAVGNLIDRIVRRFVVDFIYISLIDFPVFNVADIFVSLGCIILLLFLLFRYKDEELKPIFSFRKQEQEDHGDEKGPN